MPISREHFISHVQQNYDTYQPNEQVAAQIADIDLTTISGATGSGKNTLILATGLPRVLPETIRDPRINNGVMEQNGVEYIFRGNDLDTIVAELDRGDFVQIGMGPGLNSFYGSRVSSYPDHGPALMDIMTSQTASMRRLPLHSFETAFIVPPSYEAMEQRLASRGVLTPEDWLARRAEAGHAFNDALSDERYVLILNDELSVASRALFLLATKRERNRATEVSAQNAANRILLSLQG